MEMLRCYEMVDTDETALEQRKEPLNSVGVTSTFDIFTRAMPDNVVVIQPLDSTVGLELVTHDRATDYHVVCDKGSNCLLVDMRNDSNPNITISFDQCQYGGFCCGVSSLRAFGSLREMLVLLFSAYVGFVNFDNILEACVEHIGLAGMTQPMKHKPRGFLGYANVFAELDGANTLLMRSEQPDCDEPFLKREFAVLKDTANLRRELLSAIGTLVMNAIREMKDFAVATTMRAVDTVFPSHLLEMMQAGFLVGESDEDVDKAFEVRHVHVDLLFVYCQYSTKKWVMQMPNLYGGLQYINIK